MGLRLYAGAQFFERTLGDQTSAINDGDVAAEAFDDFEDVRGEENGGAAGDHALEHGFEGRGGDSVDAFEGLVEEKDFRAVNDGGGHGELFLHAVGIIGNQGFGTVGQLHEFEQFLSALRGSGRIEPVHAADKIQIFRSGEAAEEGKAFGDDADAGLDFDAVRCEFEIEDADAAGGRGEQAGEHLDHRGFAGAVGSEEAEELAGLDGKVDGVNGDEFAEPAGKIFGGDGDVTGHAGECNTERQR